MTNVKLKLTLCILYTLLSAVFIKSRPYDNTTDIVIKFTNSDDTFLPVDSNSDTLVVATDVNHEKRQLDALMQSERERDEDLTNLSKDAGKTTDKQLNISSTPLQEMINAERDREEMLTDITFKPASELTEDVPRFEFLIAGKINGSNQSVNSVNDIERIDRNDSDVLKKDYVELVEVKTRVAVNKSAYSLANITVHEVDDDLAPDTSFTDLQTLLLACFGTLLPLLAVLFFTLVIRCMCRRWCPQFCKKTTESSDSETSEKGSSHEQLQKTSDVGSDAAEGESTTGNGSIITMTLKNNHLIVETEERNDITKNGRETKMKYSPDNDGIFVVEVQQSAAYRPNNKSLQNSPHHEPQISTNQALIHRVAEEVESKILEEDEKSTTRLNIDKAIALSSTGLSISDLSVSSNGSHNVSYSYGSQLGYEHGPFGYPVYAGYDTPNDDSNNRIIHDNSREPLLSKTPTDHDKPVVTAAIFKQDSIIGNDIPGYCLEGCSDGPLLSDVMAREVGLQHLQDQKKLENGNYDHVVDKKNSPMKKVSRADSLPSQLEENKVSENGSDKNLVLETIAEDDIPTKENLKGKRASLPIIRTEMYESVKDALIPSGSPKFEMYNNTPSPGERSISISPPMITITEECEAKTENGS